MALIMRRNANGHTSPWSWIEQVMNEPLMHQVGELSPVEPEVLAVDVTEDAEAVTVKANLPGFAKEDVSIEVHEDVLAIQARRVEEKEEKTATVHRRERHVGAMSRRVLLPAPVVEAGAKAELKDGVLNLRLPKSRERQPRKITIN